MFLCVHLSHNTSLYVLLWLNALECVLFSLHETAWQRMHKKRCWKMIGSPPAPGSKNPVLKLRSVRSIVMAPANTGSDSNSKNAVMSTLHTNNGNLCITNPGPRILKIVVMKLMAPRILLAPDKCKLKMAKSTAPPLWLVIWLSGGYTVQPVPAPTSTSAELRSSRSDGGRSQKLILFRRGNAMSGAPIIIGTNQFPYPPISAGITMKKIMRKAWAVMSTL